MDHSDYSSHLLDIFTKTVIHQNPHIAILEKALYTAETAEDFFSKYERREYDLSSLQKLMQYFAIKLLLSNLAANLEYTSQHRGKNYICSEQYIIEPVLTSHPTEPFSREMLAIIHTLHQRLETDYPNLDQAFFKESILKLMDVKIVPHMKLLVEDEVKANLPYFFNLYSIAPDLMAQNIVLKPRSWAGGDADGNDRINATTMVMALKIQSDAVIGWHISKLNEIIEQEKNNSTLQELLELKTYLEQAIIDIYKLEEHFCNFLQKVYTLHNKFSLFTKVSQKKIQDFIYCLETFSFHLAAIDIRQNARVYEQVYLELSEYMGRPIGHEDLLAEEQLCNEIRHSYKEQKFTHHYTILHNELARIEVASVFPNTFQNLIISDTQSIKDILNPYALLRIFQAKANIVPLFETEESISNSLSITQQWIENKYYPSDLRKIKLMFGYSDSEKQAGIFILPLIAKMIQEAAIYLQSNNIQYSIFHGNGLDLARGGPTIIAAEQTLQGNQKRYFLSTKGNIYLYCNHILTHKPLYNTPPIERIADFGKLSIKKFKELFNSANLPLLESFLSYYSPYWLFVKTNNFSSRPSSRQDTDIQQNPFSPWLNQDYYPKEKVLAGIRAIPQVYAIEGTFLNFNLWYGFKEFLTAIGTTSIEQLKDFSLTKDLMTKSLIGMELTDPKVINKLLRINQDNNKLINELEEYYHSLCKMVNELDLSLPDRIKKDLAVKKELVLPIKWFMIFACRHLNPNKNGTYSIRQLFKSDLADKEYLQLITQIFGATYCGFTEYRTPPYDLQNL